MDIIAQLNRLDELIVTDRPAHGAEMRNIVAFVREQLPAYQALAQEHTALKDAHTALKDAHTKLQAEHAALQPPPAQNWGSRPRIRGRMES